MLRTAPVSAQDFGWTQPAQTNALTRMFQGHARSGLIEANHPGTGELVQQSPRVRIPNERHSLRSGRGEEFAGRAVAQFIHVADREVRRPWFGWGSKIP